MVQVPKCDIYGGRLNVEAYEITLRRVGDVEGVHVRSWHPYLSRRGMMAAPADELFGD